jgi:ABC-type lipoprotein release transport system permease subunit
MSELGIGKMGWRNLWRNPRRTLVTIGTMTVALTALVVFAGLMRGMQTALEQNVVELETGDVQIFAKGYEDRPSLYERIADPDALLAKLDQAGYPATARLRASGLAAAGASSAGALLIGVDVARDRRVSRVWREVADGRWLDPSDAKGVVVGRRLAKSLALHPGSELLLLTNAADGSMANELYRVRGVLRSMGEAIDRGGVFMNAGAWRALLVVPDGAHQIIVRRPAGVDLKTARATVARLAPGYDVKSWVELLPTLANILETQRGSMVLIDLIVYAAVAIVLLNAMMMAVFERIRELGVLKAVGMKPGSVFALVAIEGLWQTAVAVALGLALAAPLLWYLVHHGINLSSLAGASVQGVAYNSEWHAEVDRSTFTGPITMLIFAVGVALTFPAIKAARLQPVDAMHYR